MTNLACSLDAAIHRANESLEKFDLPLPDALYLMGTGVGVLPSSLKDAREIALEDVPGVPPAWKGSVLTTGRLGDASIWLMEDLCGDPAREEVSFSGTQAWVPGFPVWLAAHSGASFCVHASAGVLVNSERRDDLLGRLAIVRDHLNLSGHTPLLGLGESHLGPLFPDQTDLHHGGLRRVALSHAERLGLPVAEAVVGCTLGPSLLTPAERVFCANSGADIAVQGLASPLIASAHAGLSVLSLVAVTDDGEAGLDIRGIVAETEKLAPSIDELLTEMATEIGSLAREMRDDG